MMWVCSFSTEVYGFKKDYFIKIFGPPFDILSQKLHGAVVSNVNETICTDRKIDAVAMVISEHHLD